MLELKEMEFRNVLSLLDREEVEFTFAYGVAQGRQLGKIYVDDIRNPKSCLIMCKSGKYLVAGDTSNDEFNRFVEVYLKNKENHNNYFDMYSSSSSWIKKLDEMLGDTAAKLRRQLYEWDEASLELISSIGDKSLPEGFHLRRIDEYLFYKYVREIDSSYEELWGTHERFLANGFGFCILKDDEFVSVCNTYYTRDGYGEIDIVTKEEFRGQGFAMIVCGEFIKYCLNNSIKPIWDCDYGNEKSKRLAKKLGFESVKTYEMHWWHKNKSFVESYLNKFNYSNEMQLENDKVNSNDVEVNKESYEKSIFRLEKNDYSKIIPLFEGIEHSIALVFAIIEGHSDGRILVDDINSPRSAFIYQEGGFMFLMSEDDIFIEKVRDYVLGELLPEMDEQEMILFNFSESKEGILYELLRDKGAIVIERKVFSFDIESFKEMVSLLQPLSSEYLIQPMSKAELEEYSKEKKLGNSIEKKFGYRVMREEEIISECVSIFVGGGEAEIDINTHEDYRGRGLGKACAIAFIERCLAENLTPSWSCWPFREESIALAKRLGFHEKPDIQAHFWAENM